MARRSSRSKLLPPSAEPSEGAAASPSLRRSDQLRALVGVAGALTATLDESELLDRALRWAVTLSGHDDGSIMLARRNGRALLIRAVVGQDESRVGTVVLTSESSVAGWVLKHRQHLYLEGDGGTFPGGERAYTKEVPCSVVLPLLNTQGEPLGVVSLNSTRSTVRLDAEDIEVLQAMANLVAVALDDAAVYRALRTKNQQLEAAAGDLIKAQEEERKRVAYDIHDGLAQMIAGTYQRLQGYRAHRSLRSPAAVQDLNQVEAQLKKTVEEVRRIIGNLRPSVLDDFGLEHALRQFLADRQESADWELDLTIELGGITLPPYLQNTVFRIVQEATTNAEKYADSKQLEVKVVATGRWLSIGVRDWGRGFRVDDVQRFGHGERIGLVSMSERAAVLGGTFKVVSRPGHGTRIRVKLPILVSYAA